MKSCNADNLRALRIDRKIPVKSMLGVVCGIYPKYDKTLQSKCERGNLYGIDIRTDAMDALLANFAPDLGTAQRARKKDGHRLPCRISCRLSEGEFRLLQQHIKAEGYATVQAWLTDQVQKYLKRREAASKRKEYRTCSKN